MAFDAQAVAQKLRDFKVKNVRLDEAFDFKTKRIKALDVMTPVAGKQLFLACTDERPIEKIISPNNNEEIDPAQYVLVHAAGAAFGLVDAIRNVRVTIQRQEILNALIENEVIIANHTDTHAPLGTLTGCGYGALRSLTESGSIFDRPPVELHDRCASFEEMGAWRVVLSGDHTAEGLVVNPYKDKALDPNAPEATNSFFSLDLGIYKGILHWIEGALGFGEEAMRTMLVKMARDTLAAVFILSNAEIVEAIYVEHADEQDQFYAGVLHEGLGELKEREGAVMHVLEQRMK